ncbi:TonB-dependent hemoglobin/transferrin/lactoferrin family receptor [Ferrimonas balearica DSM 9799]|uniref:TonB-dependent hemoglobin/transferrin/lactoferrin family receptor n=1 Tax=Ferrimonas balearica (strain DSM 9799 / CCM 4581 / KCTC 23876 / PAT) TaxID=550540 RepID=E1SSY1_FERBD|nr:TonB-dependent hemoglobin/transferrin/lactoferrin family receptor [Ferrimonas balearica]ADN75037.1 TonB-dependent hemoglobin/transferrin/lactoferrin family receptor [Ferrimonas balearica DSM 9799]
MKSLPFNLVSLAVVSAMAAPVAAEESQTEVPAHRQAQEVMVVSGSRLEQSLDQVAGSVVVIDEEAIARNMSTDFSSLFRNEAAVDVKGGAGKPTSVTIRGIGGNRVMMVKDGVRVNNQYASPLGPGAEGTGRGLTEVETLKQVEVVKAAASTMYGSDALGGVVVMTTKDASDYLLGDDKYFSANAGYTGMNNEWSTGFTGAAAYGDFENLLTVQHRNGEEQQNYDETLPDSDLINNSVLFKSKYLVNDYTNIQLTLDYLDQQLDRWEQRDYNGVRNEDRDIDRRTQAFNSSLRLRSDKATILHDNLDIVMYYGFTDQQEQRDYFSVTDDQRGDMTQYRDYNFEESRIGLASTFGKYIGSDSYGHQLTFGLDVESSTMQRHRTYYTPGKNGAWVGEDQFAFADTDSLRVGAFFQDDISLLDGKLNVVAGLRYDYYRNTPDAQMAEEAGRDPADFQQMSESFWSPKLGLVYHLTDAVSVYTQYAYGYKMPTPDQKWGELEIQDGRMPFPVEIMPNYELESEKSHTIELGVRGNHHSTSYELTGFYTQAKDYIDWEFHDAPMCTPTSWGMPFPIFGPWCEDPNKNDPVLALQYDYMNRDRVEIYGIEGQVNHWLTDDFELWGNFAYTYGKDDQGNYLNTISPLKVTVGANAYTNLAGIPTQFGGVVRMAGAMDRVTDMVIIPDDSIIYKPEYNEAYTTAGYAVVDLTMAMELTSNWKLRAGVFNLFDKEYVEYADVAGQSKYLMDNMGAPESNFTQPGRYVNLNVNYRF